MLPLEERRAGLDKIFLGLFDEKPKDTPPKSLVTLSGETPRILIEGIANRILVDSQKGVLAHWADVGVICRNLAPYGEMIQKIFSVYKIPVAVHGSLPTSTQGPAFAILSLLESIGRPMPDNIVDRAFFIKHLLSLSTILCSQKIADQLYFLQTYSLDETGQPIRRKAPVQNLQELLDAADHPKVTSHLELVHRLRNRAKTATGISSFIEVAKIIIQAYAQNSFVAKRFEVKQCKQGAGAVRMLMRTLDRLEQNARIFSLIEGDWAENFTRFKDLLDAVGIPMMERYLDAVHVVDVMEARNWEWKETYLVGLVNGEFPKAVPEDLYCKDIERTALSAPAAHLFKRAQGRGTSILLCRQPCR